MWNSRGTAPILEGDERVVHPVREEAKHCMGEVGFSGETRWYRRTQVDPYANLITSVENITL